MTRKKVTLAYITNDSSRKATFKKRKKGLVKKVSELSTLCDIKACAIIYSPYEPQPEVWPSAAEAQRVLGEFKKLSELEQGKKMMNQESFLRQRIAKASEQLRKTRKDNREKEMVHVMYQSLVADKGLHGLNMVDLNDLGWLVDRSLKEIDRRVESINKEVAPVVAPIGNYHHGMAQDTRAYEVNMETMPKQEWFNTGPVLDRARVNYDMAAMDRQHQKWLMDLITAPQQPVVFGGGGGDEMVAPPFGEANHNNLLWSSAFFPEFKE